MPSAVISIYLNEEDYQKYIKDKEKYNSMAREVIKREIEKKK